MAGETQGWDEVGSGLGMRRVGWGFLWKVEPTAPATLLDWNRSSSPGSLGLST